MDETNSEPVGNLITADPDAGAAPDAPSSAKHPDGIITGLSAIIGDRLGLDPLWVRLGFVLLTLLGGIGLVVYLGLWLLLVVGVDGDRSWARLLGGAVVLGLVPVLISETDLGFASGTMAIVALLGGLAVALWRSSPDSEPRQPLLADGPTGDSVAFGARHQMQRDGAPVASQARMRRVQRPPSVLGQATLASAVVVGAAGALIDELNGGRLHPEQWLGAAASVCGFGLLVGALRGHARWLIVPALLLAGAGYGGGLLARTGIGIADTAGDRHLSVGAESASRLSTDVGFGRTVLSILEIPREPVVVDATMAVGEMMIEASDLVAVEIRSTGDQLTIRRDGQIVRSDVLRLGPDRAPDVIVNATLLRGKIEIRRVFSDAFVFGPDGNDVLTGDGPPVVDQISVVADGVAVTPDGWLVLGEGDAIVSMDFEMIYGIGSWIDDGTFLVETSFGDYRIIDDVLLTPTLAVYRLEDIRAGTVRVATTLSADHPPIGQEGDG